jgi:hypothetical protein
VQSVVFSTVLPVPVVAAAEASIQVAARWVDAHGGGGACVLSGLVCSAQPHHCLTDGFAICKASTISSFITRVSGQVRCACSRNWTLVQDKQDTRRPVT